MAVYTTQIQHGGSKDWHDDADLTIEIINRHKVVPAHGQAATGTQVMWSSPQGNGNITFFDDATSFKGSAQFPKEGPVAYRGQLKAK